MPVSLAKIAADIAKVTLYVNDDSLTVYYYPSKITDETIALGGVFLDLNSVQGAMSAMESLNSLLCGLIQSWDLFEDEEQTTMVPVTPERLKSIPTLLKGKIIGAIMSDIRPEGGMPQIPNK